MDVPGRFKSKGQKSIFRSVSYSFQNHRYGQSDLGIDKIPITRAGFFSLVTFAWLIPIVWALYRRGLASVLYLQWWEEDTAEYNINRLEEVWKAEKRQQGPERASFGRAIRNAFKRRIICSVAVVMVAMSFSFIGSALILRFLLAHVSSSSPVVGQGAAIVVSLILCEICRSLSFSLAWALNYWNGIKVRSASMGLLYKKILKLRSLKEKKIGELVNLCSNDGQRLFEVMANGPFIVAGPVFFLVGSVYLVFLIGPWGLIGCATYIIFFIVLKFVADLMEIFRTQSVVLTGERVGLMTEVLTCMKLIKMNAWETAFVKRISGKRLEEQASLEKAYFLQSIMTSLVPSIPVISSVFMFLAYILSGNNLTATQAFTLISVLYSISLSLALMTHGFRTLSEASVAARRYKEVLMMDEIGPRVDELTDDSVSVMMQNATLGWETEDEDDDVSVDGGIGGISADELRQSKRMKMSERREKENSFPPEDAVDGGMSLKSDVHESRMRLLESTSSQEETPQLTDITLKIEKGKLVGICGMKGSGKSSLLAALLGRMQVQSGKIGVRGRIAYVSQEPWIINGTARDNILFGKAYEQNRYKEVVDACGLEKDFETFGAGDRVEIGDRGLTLSGGQKQRISLARAVYSDSDIYLLDDPMSALDIHIGQDIFSKCIKTMLHGKTILFVTHHLEYLCRCDYVLFMDFGRVLEAGTHAELVLSGRDYAELIELYQTKFDEIQRERRKAVIADREERITPQRGFSRGFSRKLLQHHLSRLSTREGLQHQFSMTSTTSTILGDYDYVDIEDLVSAQHEKDDECNVSKKVYHNYIKAAGGYCAILLILSVFCVSIGIQSGALWWLAYWLGEGDGNVTLSEGNITMPSGSVADHPDVKLYAAVFGIFVASMVIAVAIRGLVFMRILLKAASRLHKQLLKKLMTSPMKFFDTTPLGTIINRFAGDMDEIDVRLPSNFELYLQNVFLVLFALAMICVVFPWDLLVIVPLIVVFCVLAFMFSPILRRLKYIDSVTRSPYLSHLAASIEGISTIHVYGQSNRFEKLFCDMLDRNTIPFFLFYSANRWLALFLDLMTTVIIGFTGFLVVFTLTSENSAQAGLALSFAMQITSLLQYTLRMSIETGARFTSVQRIQGYIENLTQEGAITGEERDVPVDWPVNGYITFQKYRMRYHEGLPLALKGISLNIQPKDKIGIVGASGSGKSTLGVALFRLAEAASGGITIDGYNIRDVKLIDLRSRLSILVQDPVLFFGTIRYNLDPAGHCHSDSTLWEALEKCHIKQKVAAQEKQLDTLVEENGRNFSLGERQLLCLARTLLRHSKILILDEATASIDTRTEILVQQTIKEEFRECTVLIIAHRLTTVLDCDKILVMDKGKVLEFDAPSMLLRKNHSKFKSMVEALKTHSRDSVVEDSRSDHEGVEDMITS